MIVDFQHHFTPHALMPKDLGRRKLVSYDEHGAPSFIMHWMLFDLDEHIAMMDAAGIDVAFLTSAAGMCADIDRSRLCNDAAKKAERDYPGRFIGAAHANPLGGQSHVLDDLRRAEMRALLMDRHIHLAELQFGNHPQRLIERVARETERGTCDVHGGLHAWIEVPLPPAARRL